MDFEDIQLCAAAIKEYGLNEIKMKYVFLYVFSYILNYSDEAEVTSLSIEKQVRKQKQTMKCSLLVLQKYRCVYFL